MTCSSIPRPSYMPMRRLYALAHRATRFFYRPGGKRPASGPASSLAILGEPSSVLRHRLRRQRLEWQEPESLSSAFNRVENCSIHHSAHTGRYASVTTPVFTTTASTATRLRRGEGLRWQFRCRKLVGRCQRSYACRVEPGAGRPHQRCQGNLLAWLSQPRRKHSAWARWSSRPAARASSAWPDGKLCAAICQS